MIQLEDMQAQVRKEYEMLRIEFEQNLAANEQTGPINREMRHLITSLQNHITQLKGEIHRYKRKYKEAANDGSKVSCRMTPFPCPLLFHTVFYCKMLLRWWSFWCNIFGRNEER